MTEKPISRAYAWRQRLWQALLATACGVGVLYVC